MKCNYEIKNIFHNSLSYEEMKYIICEKIARLIILEEKEIYTF